MKIIETLKGRKRRFYKSFILAISVSVLTSLASYMGYLEGFEAKALDLLFWMRGQQKSPEIVLVQIDDQAFSNLGERQPLPRAYLAGLIELVARGGAKVIALDIELKVPTASHEDEALVKAIQSAEESGLSKVVPVYVIRSETEQDGTRLYRRTRFFSPKLPPVAGFANAPVDPDGFVRQIPLAVKDSNGNILPSLGLAVLARYAGYDAAHLEAALNSESKVTLVLPQWNKFKGRLLPRPTQFSFALEDSWKINFAGSKGSFQAIPSDPVFHLSTQNSALAPDNLFRGKIVLIGATFAESRDFYPTPRGLMSGVEIHANIIHTLLSRSQILPANRLLGLAISLIFAGVISLLLTLLRPSMVKIFSYAAIPVLLIPSYLAFAYLGLWVDFVTPVLIICWGASLGDFLASRHIRKSLGEFVDREIANQIVDQEEGLLGQKREVSVLFTDVRNYTTMCEVLPTEKVIESLNELFAAIGTIISRHRGWIVDFIGDTVLAVFGAPKDNPTHAWDAVQTAIEVHRQLNELNEKWQKKGIATLQIGIGIHSGDVVMGIIGSEERKKFDVTGDTVNTAARVEGLNKEFTTSILITRETLARVDGHFKVVSRGTVQVKGREKEVEVFEVLGTGT